jgi:hypothetical protein
MKVYYSSVGTINLELRFLRGIREMVPGPMVAVHLERNNDPSEPEILAPVKKIHRSSSCILIHTEI